MLRKKMSVLTRRGQILVETMVACALMLVVMLAFAKLIELRKSQKKNFNSIGQRIEALNAKSNQTERPK